MGLSTNDVAGKDVQTKPGVVEYAGGMGRIAMHKMNLLHLDQNTRTLLQLKPYQTSVLLDLHSENRKE